MRNRLSDLSDVRLTAFVETARRHLQTPLYVNAYYLIVNTAINSLLGLVFWTAAARLYASEEVGIASATISVMTLLAGLSSLGLEVGLVRFLPAADHMSASMLDSALTAVGISSLACAAVFLVGLPFWSPPLTLVYEQLGFSAVFSLLTVLTALGKVIDGAFIARRAARFTLLRQAGLNAIKIPLLPVFVAVGGAFGIIVSLAVATTASFGVALVCCLPAVQEAYAPRLRLSKKMMTSILPYAVGNHLANHLAQSPQVVLPLVVLNVLGPSDSAYFYVTWMIANLLFAVPRSIATSIVAEGANRESGLRENVNRATRVIFVLLVPAIILTVTVGDKLLLVFGRDYAGQGRALLLILALSALPVGLNQLYFAINRVRKDTGRNLVVALLLAGVTLGLSCVLMVQHGIVGTGIGWLVGQSALSVYVVTSLYRYAR